MIVDHEWVRGLANEFKGGKTFLSRVQPGNPIPIHTDERWGMRIHIPLVTNDKAWFVIGDEKINMKRGSAYKIDSHIPHGVVNEGVTDRIHLIVNV